MANPAPYVTFNSITDATNYGDERNFVMIQGANGKYTDDVTIENGKEYSVRIYVHNNAASNLNLVARDVVTKLNVPTQTADRIQIDGYVNSSDPSPTSVWDQAVFHGAGRTGPKFNLSYVAGSRSTKTQSSPAAHLWLTVLSAAVQSLATTQWMAIFLAVSSTVVLSTSR